MNKEDIFIKNIASKEQDRISVATVYERMSYIAHKGCGLHYEIYESRLIGMLIDHCEKLGDVDAKKLRLYAESKGTRLDEETFSEALDAERECFDEIRRNQM
ncbi:dpoa decarboxylase [Serratia marcescens]|uniref:dpoa decarboxylase n=1 Tax=Serratia marcescens TaxID=615 RepID=UPI0036FC202A